MHAKREDAGRKQIKKKKKIDNFFFYCRPHIYERVWISNARVVWRFIIEFILWPSFLACVCSIGGIIRWKKKCNAKSRTELNGQHCIDRKSSTLTHTTTKHKWNETNKKKCTQTTTTTLRAILPLVAFKQIHFIAAAKEKYNLPVASVDLRM